MVEVSRNPIIVSQNGEDVLVVPRDCEARYRYWAGGQSLEATLRELGASAEMMRRYCGNVAADAVMAERQDNEGLSWMNKGNKKK